MSRIVVLGAGASYGATQDRPVPCPLVNWFFDAAERLGLVQRAFAGLTPDTMEAEIQAAGGDIRGVVPDWNASKQGAHLDALLGLVHEQLGIAPRSYLDLPIDVERIMGLIEAELLGVHSMRRLTGEQTTLMGSPADHLEQQMYFIICGVLVKAAGKLGCPNHDAIARWLRPEDAVISFNYDLLMDRALRARPDWSPARSYMMPFTRVGRRHGEEVEWLPPPTSQSGRPPVPLYKPHGSLNWLVPRDPWQTNLNVQLDVNSPERIARSNAIQRVVYHLQDLNSDFERDFPLLEWWGRYEHEQDDYSFDLHSLIVPPAITKPYRDLEPVVGHLWAFMQHELVSRCTELYLIGYSLREADLRSSWLFRKAAIDGTIERVVVVDPSDDVYARVQNVFGAHRVERAEGGIVEFAGSLPG